MKIALVPSHCTIEAGTNAPFSSQYIEKPTPLAAHPFSSRTNCSVEQFHCLALGSYTSLRILSPYCAKLGSFRPGRTHSSALDIESNYVYTVQPIACSKIIQRDDFSNYLASRPVSPRFGIVPQRVIEVSAALKHLEHCLSTCATAYRLCLYDSIYFFLRSYAGGS